MIKRYDPHLPTYEDGFPVMQKRDDGDYVKFTDHEADKAAAAAEARADERRKCVEELRQLKKSYSDEEFVHVFCCGITYSADHLSKGNQ
jgi:histidinol phosphatase-like PHP family hydrolase